MSSEFTWQSLADAGFSPVGPALFNLARDAGIETRAGRWVPIWFVEANAVFTAAGYTADRRLGICRRGEKAVKAEVAAISLAAHER